MFCLLLLVSAIGIALSAPAEDLPNLGIVGGERAKQESFSYQISLQFRGRHHCGGTLVKTNLVVTAAHCTKGIHYSYFTVRVGSADREAGGRVYAVVDLIDHPEFTMQTLRHDVAVLKLAEHVPLSKTVSTLPLADADPAANTQALVSGWGHTQENGRLSDYLQFAKVKIFDRAYCQQHVRPFTPEMICAGQIGGGVDACQADSGGPLVAGNKLVGIVSFGIGCARPNNPGVYASVAALRPWIDRTIYLLSF